MSTFVCTYDMHLGDAHENCSGAYFVICTYICFSFCVFGSAFFAFSLASLHFVVCKLELWIILSCCSCCCCWFSLLLLLLFRLVARVIAYLVFMIIMRMLKNGLSTKFIICTLATTVATIKFIHSASQSSSVSRWYCKCIFATKKMRIYRTRLNAMEQEVAE